MRDWKWGFERGGGVVMSMYVSFAVYMDSRCKGLSGGIYAPCQFDPILSQMFKSCGKRIASTDFHSFV